MTQEERAIETVKARNPHGTKFLVMSVVPRFLHGTLFIIGYQDDKGLTYENYAYVHDDGESVEVYRVANQLAQAVAAAPNRQTPFEHLVGAGGIAGILAIVITGTICYICASHSGIGDIKIPDALTHGLSTILGFYFGTKAAKS